MPYPVILDIVDNAATWNITSADTANSGFGKAQLSYRVDEVVKKTIVYTTYVEPSVEADSVPRDPYENYLDSMIALGVQIAETKEDVEETAAEAESTLSEVQALIAAGAVRFADDDGNITVTYPTGGN